METYEIPNDWPSGQEGPLLLCSWTTPKLEEAQSKIQWYAVYNVDYDGTVRIHELDFKMETVPAFLRDMVIINRNTLNYLQDWEHFERDIEYKLYKGVL